MSSVETPELVRLRVRVLPQTKELLEGFSIKHGVLKAGCKVNLGPLLDLIASKLSELASIVPDRSGKRWRLRSDQVRLIRISTDKQGALAAEHRVDPSTISRVKSGQAYAWVK